MYAKNKISHSLTTAHKIFCANCKINKLIFVMGGGIILCTAPVFAEDLSFTGNTNIHGNSPFNISNNEYENINIIINGVDNGYYTDTTEALIISGDNIQNFSATQSVNIVNTAQNEKIDNNGAIYARDSSTINFTDLDYIYIAAIAGAEGRNDSTAISAKTPYSNGISGILDNYTQNNTVNISGKCVQIIGSLDVSTTFFHEGTNIINLSLTGNDSFWYGSTIGESQDSLVNLSLADGASWIFNASGSLLNKDGQLSNLTLNNGVVILDDNIIWEKYNNTIINGTNYILANYREKNATYSTVEIENLKGSGGIFQMNIDWLSNQGKSSETDKIDFIYITNVIDEGSKQYIDFNLSNAHLDLMNVGDKLYFAKVENGNTIFVSAADNYIQNSADEVRLYSYSTQKELSNDYTLWYLTKYLGNTNEYVPFIKGAAFASYSLATDMDRFNKRRGESRYVSGENDGLWVRYAYTDLSWDNAFDMDKHMIQLGYDHKLAAAHGSHYLGASFDYTKANIDIDVLSGDSDSERYALNLYYTYIADSGLYADFVLKGGVIDSDYDIKNSNGTDIGSDIDQIFYGISAESGYKFNFTNSLFIEPQAQLQFIHLDGDKFTSKGGVNAKIHALDSIIGRIGFSAGYEFNSEQNKPCGNIYIKADIMHEFDGDKEIDMLGRTTSYSDKFSGKETWYDIGVGTDFAAAKNTKIYFEAEHIFGAEFENTWQINAGARYEF